MLAEIALSVLIAAALGRMFWRLVVVESGGWLHTVHDLGAVSFISYILLMILALSMAVYRAFCSIALIRRIREGRLHINPSYREAAVRNKMVIVLYFVLFLTRTAFLLTISRYRDIVLCSRGGFFNASIISFLRYHHPYVLHPG